MDKIAFLFSGQGAQYPGMGKAVYESSSAAKKVFDSAEKIRPNTINQCFFGDKETLSNTLNTQPCLYTVDFATAKALEEFGVSPVAVAGFSLGEIAALTFAGIFSSEDGFHFVCERARQMNLAAQNHQGSMAAVLKLSNQEVKELCNKFENVYPVNYNCPGQLVVAGEKESLKAFSQLVSQKGGRAIELAVSGAFHSPFMDCAAQALEAVLADYYLSRPSVSVFSNVTAQPFDENPRNLILQQVNHPVLWQKTIENMISQGINVFIEVGAGKTLTGLMKKINPNVKAFHVDDKASFDFVVNNFSKGATQC